MGRLKYAVLRLEPDEVKQEVFNVGVVAHAPESRQVLLRVAEAEDSRLRHCLSEAQLFIYRKYIAELKKYTRRISTQLVDEVTGRAMNDESWLDALNDSLGNGFRLGTIHPAQAENAEGLLDRLYASYVSSSKGRIPTVVQLLLVEFRIQGIETRINKDVPIRGIPTPVTAAFGYETDSPRYIQPISIQRNSRENLKEGALWAQVLNEYQSSNQSGYFFFVLKKQSQADIRSLDRLSQWLTCDQSRVMDFDSDRKKLVQQVLAELQA